MLKATLIAVVGMICWLWWRGRLAMWAKAAGRSRWLAGGNPLDPHCGRCGYIVRGISSFICPECGKDLRQVGIIAGRQIRSIWSNVLMMAILWSVTLYAMGAFVAEAVIRALPQNSRVIYTVSLERPQSHAYHRVAIQGSDLCRLDKAVVVVPKRTLSLRTLDGRSSTLELDLASGAYAYAGGDGRKVQVDGGFDTKAVLAWIKAAGIDPTLPGLETEAVEIVDRATAAPPPYQGTSHFSSHSTGQTAGFASLDVNWDGSPVEQKGLYATAAAGLFLLWLAGLWVLLRRNAPAR